MYLQIKRISPVSYTHLDVYKRQLYTSGITTTDLDADITGQTQDVIQMCIRDRVRPDDEGEIRHCAAQCGKGLGQP